MRAIALIIVLAVVGGACRCVPMPASSAFCNRLRPAAQQLGVTPATFNAVTRGLTPDLSLPDLVVPGRKERPPGQPEFVQTPAQYLRERTLARLVAQGRGLAAAHRATLAAIERQLRRAAANPARDLGTRNRFRPRSATA